MLRGIRGIWFQSLGFMFRVVENTVGKTVKKYGEFDFVDILGFRLRVFGN